MQVQNTKNHNEQNESGLLPEWGWNPPYLGSLLTPCIIDSCKCGQFFNGVFMNNKAYIIGNERRFVNETGETISTDIKIDGAFLFDVLSGMLIDNSYDLNPILVINGKYGIYDSIVDKYIEPPEWDFICDWVEGNHRVVFASKGCIPNEPPLYSLPVNGFINLYGEDDFPTGGNWWLLEGLCGEVRTLSPQKRLRAFPVDYAHVMSRVSQAYYYNFCVNRKSGRKKPTIGSFFVVNKSILYSAVEKEKAVPCGDHKINQITHEEIWDEHFQDAFFFDYDYYPRGRVEYRLIDGCYLVYIDRCLKSRDIVHIIDTFGLMNSLYEVIIDEEYQCYKCEVKNMESY